MLNMEGILSMPKFYQCSVRHNAKEKDLLAQKMENVLTSLPRQQLNAIVGPIESKNEPINSDQSRAAL